MYWFLLVLAVVHAGGTTALKYVNLVFPLVYSSPFGVLVRNGGGMC